MAPRTTPLSKQITLTGTPTHLGGAFDEKTSNVGIRLTVPQGAMSAVYLGDETVTPSGETGGGIYFPGTSTRLPTTSLAGWYAVTNGASVTVSVELASGGSTGAPEWADAGGAGGSGGGGGGGGTVNQGAAGVDPWLVTETNSEATLIAVEGLATTVDTQTPALDAKGINVRVIGEQRMAVGPGAAAPGATAQSVYVIELAERLAPLVGLSTEATLQLVLAALEANGGKIDGLAAALAPLLTEATGAAILAQLEASGATAESILADTSGILAGLGNLATGADVAAVGATVSAGNATLSTISATIANQATAAKQDLLKAAVDAMAANVALLVAQTDELEPDVDATRIATQASAASLASIDAKNPALVGGKVPVDASGSSVSIAGTANVAVTNFPATQAVAGTVQATGAGGAALALDASVDGLEALANTGNTNTAAAAVSLASIDAGTVAALGKQPIAGSASITQATGDTFTVDTELAATGALATEAKQDAGNATLTSIDAGIPAALGAAGGMRVEGVAGGQAVAISAASLPLAMDAATATNQATGNASLASIDAGTPNALGQAAAGASMPVVLPATQSSGEVAQQSTLATRASEATLATRASEASVDQIEGYLDGVEGLLTTIRDQGGLGAALATTTHTVTNAVTQLPSFAAPRGFTVQNPSGNVRSIFVKENNTVTTANGIEIVPGTSEDFLLANANQLFAIAAAGSNPIIIAEIH